MQSKKLRFLLFRDSFAICKLDKDAPVPGWAYAGSFVSITRTPDELSITCAQSYVPEKIQCQKDWRCLKVQGPFDFSVIGVIASFATLLAEFGISIFVVCTFETDYLLVQESDLEKTANALLQQGHQVDRQLNRPR